MSSKAINNDSPAERERRQGEVVILEEFEKLVADLAQPSYLFRVYVSGLRSRSVPAIAKLRGICDQYLPGRYELIIIDIEATHDSPAQSGTPRETEVGFPSGDSKCISVYVSLCEMNADLPSLCIVDSDLTERKKRDELARSGRLATAILEGTAEAIAVCDETGKIIRANRALEDLCGFNPLDQRFDSALPLEIARSEPGGPVLHLSISDALNGCVILRAKEVHFRRKDGRAFALLLTSTPIKDSSSVMGCIVNMTDVTERKRAKEQLKKLNRTLKAMSRSNKALLHTTDESTYLQEVCRIITEDCGYLLTWIGFAENDEAKTVRPAVYSGFEEGYLETLKISWDDSENGRGPSGTAIRTGLPALCRNVLTDPAFTPWREEALKRGYLANLAVPIMEEERAVGVVSFYSQESDAFSEAETTLLMDLAADMAFGINTLRLRADHARAEKLLRAREAKYREVAEYVPALLWAADTHGVATYHNRRWHQYTGQPLERGRGNGWQDIVYPEDLQRTKERWSESVQTGKDFSIEYRLRRASDGAYRWHAVQGTLEKDEQGKPIGWYGNLIDIDDRKRAEEAQRNSERLYRAIGESINYGVWMCAPDGRNTYVSESFLKLTGMTQQQCTDLGWSEALHPDDAERTTAAWKECMQTEEPWDVEQRYLGVDGKWHPILSRGVPVRDDEGKIIAWAGINLDISELKQAEHALIRSEKLASVGRMAATIAHEINNPLASTMNALYLVRTDPALPECVKHDLAVAEHELRRVSHISKQTLGFYREVGNPTSVDLPVVLDSLLDLYGSRLRNKSISVRRSYRCSARICAIAGELRQIISNVIANSIDALPEGGKLHVRLFGPQILRGKRHMIRLTIADDGKGIAAENLKRIFEPFFTTKKSIGTGLGLWVASELVKKHEGRLRIKSRLGKGTVLTVWLPTERRTQERKST